MGPGILEVYSGIFQDWKVLENYYRSWKVLEILINSCKNVFFKNNCLQYYIWISISLGFIASIIVHLGVLEKSL